MRFKQCSEHENKEIFPFAADKQLLTSQTSRQCSAAAATTFFSIEKRATEIRILERVAVSFENDIYNSKLPTAATDLQKVTDRHRRAAASGETDRRKNTDPSLPV